MEKWSSKNCSSFCKNLALNLNPITSTVSWIVLEYNLPVFTPTSKLGFDKILNSVLRNELQRLNKQSTFLRWVSKQNLFCVNQKNRISSIFFFICLFLHFIPWKYFSTNLHPVHGFPDLIKMMGRAEGLQPNIC